VDHFIEKYQYLVESKKIVGTNLINYDETRIGPQHGEKGQEKRIISTQVGNGRKHLVGTRRHALTSLVPFVLATGEVFVVFYIAKANFKKEEDPNEDAIVDVELYDFG